MGPSPPTLSTVRRSWWGRQPAGPGQREPSPACSDCVSRAGSHLLPAQRAGCKDRPPSLSAGPVLTATRTRALSRFIMWEQRLQAGTLLAVEAWGAPSPSPQLGVESSDTAAPGLEGSRTGGPRGGAEIQGEGTQAEAQEAQRRGVTDGAKLCLAGLPAWPARWGPHVPSAQARAPSAASRQP